MFTLKKLRGNQWNGHTPRLRLAPGLGGDAPGAPSKQLGRALHNFSNYYNLESTTALGALMVFVCPLALTPPSELWSPQRFFPSACREAVEIIKIL